MVKCKREVKCNQGYAYRLYDLLVEGHLVFPGFLQFFDSILNDFQPDPTCGMSELGKRAPQPADLLIRQ